MHSPDIELDFLGPSSTTANPCLRPLIGPGIRAGFPSPADDYIEEWLDLSALLVGEEKEAVFFFRVRGLSMIDAGIRPGDLLVVNRAKTAQHGDIVVAVIDSDLTVKQLYLRAGITELRPANKEFTKIVLKDGQVLQIWGVVTSCIHQFRK